LIRYVKQRDSMVVVIHGTVKSHGEVIFAGTTYAPKTEAFGAYVLNACNRANHYFIQAPENCCS